MKEWREGDGTREEGRLSPRKDEAGIRKEGPEWRTGRGRKRDRRLRRGRDKHTSRRGQRTSQDWICQGPFVGAPRLSH